MFVIPFAFVPIVNEPVDGFGQARKSARVCSPTPTVPSCDTVTTTGARPVTVTVIWAVRGSVPEFSVKLAVMVPFPLPEGVTVHHPELLDAIQLVFDVTVNVVTPSLLVTFWLGGVTASVAAAPDCETVTVWAGRPVTVTVMVATRGDVEAFAVYVAEIEPFPEPLLVTVHHVALEEAVQLELDVTSNEVFPADAVTFWFDGVTLSVGAAPAAVNDPTCPIPA